MWNDRGSFLSRRQINAHNLELQVIDSKDFIKMAERTTVANHCKLLKRKPFIAAPPQAARQNAHT